MPDNTYSTLANIKTKIRRLTRSPSTSQLSDADLNNYINTFILYDFSVSLSLETLKDTLTFFTKPYIDTYETSDDVNNPLYNFKNKYMVVSSPLYIAGSISDFTQSYDSFYALYPKTNELREIATGNSVEMHYVGTLTHVPILRNNVLFTSVDLNDNGLELHDDGEGGLIGDGIGAIDYLTGEYDLVFANAPKISTVVYSQTVPYLPTVPTSVLYYNNAFTVRPIPDQPYRVEINAYRRPTEILDNATMPELSQWWQYIAYGAA
ncbi:MAG: hypothetical protein DRP50_08015, partial [Thermotoga sp.]